MAYSQLLVLWNRSDQGWCKYCASLEKELTSSLEAKDRWTDETSWEDVSFKQVDPYFESRTSTSLPEQADSRKRKHASVCAAFYPSQFESTPLHNICSESTSIKVGSEHLL